MLKLIKLMIKKMLNSFKRARYFWRYITFTEVGIIYITKVMRSMAIKLSSSISLIFIYKLGYPVWFLALYIFYYYIVKLVAVILGGAVVAKYGPKHGMIISNILYVPMLLSMSLAKSFGVPAIILGATMQALSVGIYNVSVNVDFSKVKNTKTSGKQLGLSYIFDKITTVVAPVIGGLTAMIFGAPIVMIISAIIFALATIPLVISKEPIKTNQKLKFHNFSWRLYGRNIVAQSYEGVLVVNLFIWGFFASVFIFSAFNSYGASGIIQSFSALAAILATFFYAKVTDKGNGNRLMKINTLIQSGVWITKGLLVKTPLGALLAHAGHDLALSGQHMSVYKGIYDEADRSGCRITYIVMHEIVAGVMAIICSSLLLFMVVFNTNAEEGIRHYFAISSIFILILLFAKFKVYDTKNIYKEE